MLAILKNNYCRMVRRLGPTLIMIVLMLLSIVLAVYMTNAQKIKGHIAYVSQMNIKMPAVSGWDIHTVSQKPPRSALFEQQYDAYVIYGKNGKMEVETLKGHAFKSMLLNEVNHHNGPIKGVNPERGIGENIVGFLMMFLLMSAFMNLFTFADDKERGQLDRIAASPITFSGILAAHFLYALSMYIPAYLELIGMKWLGYNIGFNLWQYGFLFVTIGFLGISFAILLNTLFKKPDNATMLGNSIIVLTSILAGSFYSFSKDNKILDGVLKFLPQKQLLAFVGDLESGAGSVHFVSILYVWLIALLFLGLSCYVLRRQYVKKV